MKKTILIVVLFMLWVSPVSGQTIGPVGCGVGKNNCHSNEDPKMIDKHKNAIDNMMGSDNLATYTEKAGLDLKGVLVGNNICMSCHGTVISGKEKKEVEEGVTCESCHGAGGAYKGPHIERLPTEKKGDPNRSGYTQSLALGLINLKDISVRAKECVRCHYITDQRVLASGHPDGSKFNYAAGMKSVGKHWTTHAITDADLNKDSFSAAKKGTKVTGQVMAVKTTPPPPPQAPTPTPVPAVVAVAPPPVAMAPSAKMIPIKPVAPMPIPMVSMDTPPPLPTAAMDIPPFPEIEGKKLDEVLVILKKRIELLYEKTK